MPLSTIVSGHDLEVTIYCSMFGQVAQNVFHMEVNTATGAPTTDDIVQQVEADFNGSWKGWLSSEAQWEGLSIRNLTPAPLEVASFSGAQSGPGTAGDALPGQLSGLLTKKTNIAGPKGRGRMYIPFPGLDMWDGVTGGLSAAGETQLQAIIDDIKGPESETAGGFSINWTIGLYRPAEAVRLIPLRSFTGSAFFATQKRRGHYGPLNTLPSELQ